jgi:hypothetical protein
VHLLIACLPPRAEGCSFQQPPCLIAPPAGPPLAALPQPCASEPNAGNGADLPGYSWTQTLVEAVVSVPVPPGTKGRACDVAITRDRLRVGLKGQPPVLGERPAAPPPPPTSASPAWAAARAAGADRFLGSCLHSAPARCACNRF